MRLRRFDAEDEGEENLIDTPSKKFNWECCSIIVSIVNLTLVITFCIGLIGLYLNIVPIIDSIDVRVYNMVADIKGDILSILRREFSGYKNFTDETLNFVHNAELCAKKLGVCKL